MRHIILLTLLLCPIAKLNAKEYLATTLEELSNISKSLKPGDSLNISAGKYKGGILLKNLKGTAESPIRVSGSGIDKTVFENGRQALHLVNCHYIILENFSVKNFSLNGINADDGGSQQNPSSNLHFKNISITEIGPKGNLDALKLSGIHNFSVQNCFFSGWGGSAIDMVGCHNGVISDCTLRSKPGHSQDTGIQIKGGSSKIKVYQNTFAAAGQRAINLGGSTGTKWFRPLGAKYEAKDIEIAGNTFIRGMAHIAFVTSQNSYVHHNIFYKPDKWFCRILQETNDSEFIKCQTGKLTNNIFVFDQKVRSFVNVGQGTSPETFIFRENLWQDSMGNRKPVLPVKETNGTYNTGLKLTQSKNGTFELDAKFQNFGPSAFKVEKDD